jgi:hypothetical protein
MSNLGPLGWSWPANEDGKVIGWGPRGAYLKNYSAILGEHFLFANPVEPRFGAAGDDSTDDTAEIQAAIDWLEVQGGGTLVINHGHRITSSLAFSTGKVNVYSPNSYQGYLTCIGAFTPIHYTIEGVRENGAPVIQNLGFLRGDSNNTSTAIRLESTVLVGDADGEVSGANKGALVQGVRIESAYGSEKVITGATQADPVVITSVAHGYTTGDEVRIADVEGMTELNDREYEITVLSADTFSLNNEDGGSYGAYTGGGTVQRQSSGYWKNGVEIHLMPYTHIDNCWIKGRGATTTTKIGAGVLMGHYCHGSQVYDSQIRGFLGAIHIDDTEFFDHPVRANATAYAVGDIITVSSNTQYRFICTTAGTSAGSLPGDYATAARNDEVTDGTAIFASSGFQSEGLGVKKNKFQANDRGFYSTITSAENTWSIQNNSFDCGYANIWLRNGFRVAIEGNTFGWNNRRKDHVDIYLERTDGATADEAYKLISSIKNNICFRTGNLDLTVTAITRANPAVISYTKAADDPHPVADDILFLKNVSGMTEVTDIPFKAGTVVQTNDTSGTVVMLDYVSGANINSSAYGAWTSGGAITRYGRFVELGTARNVHIRDNIIAARNVGLHLAAATETVSFVDNEWTTTPDREIYNLSTSPNTIVAGSQPNAQHRVEVFRTRADFVSALADKMSRADGVVTMAGGLEYKWQTGATGITDLPGLVPYGDVTPYHYGATGDGVVYDTTMLSAMNTAGKLAFLTPGTYRTLTAPTVSIPLLSLGGVILPDSGTFLPKHLYDFGTYNYFYTRRTVLASEYTATPTVDYTPVPESSAQRIRWGNLAGYQQTYLGNYAGSFPTGAPTRMARTGMEALHIQGSHDGYGDGYDETLTMAVTAHPGHALVTQWAGHNSGGLIGGQVNALERTGNPPVGAGVGKVNLYGIGDIALNDQGLDDVAMIGMSLILTCDGADIGTYEIPRVGYYVASNGANDVDAALLVNGDFKIGIDLSDTTISTGAAIAMKSGDYIHLDATPDTAEGNFIADDVGDVKIGYSGTAVTIVNDTKTWSFTDDGVTGAPTFTVVGLPTGAAGQRAFVTDANATTFASIVAGGGANGVPVYHDGTNWRIG